jgi:hypothetical protein
MHVRAHPSQNQQKSLLIGRTWPHPQPDLLVSKPDPWHLGQFDVLPSALPKISLTFFTNVKAVSSCTRNEAKSTQHQLEGFLCSKDCCSSYVSWHLRAKLKLDHRQTWQTNYVTATQGEKEPLGSSCIADSLFEKLLLFQNYIDLNCHLLHARMCWQSAKIQPSNQSSFWEKEGWERGRKKFRPHWS